MPNLISCCAGLFSRLSSQQPRRKSNSKTQKEPYPVPDAARILQPYRTMTSSNKYNIYLEDGANDPVPVIAYLDSVLKSSLVSEKIALQTKAEFIALQQSVRLEDDRGRQYVCDRKINVNWYLPDGTASTFFETFYVFSAVDLEIDVRLRADIIIKLQEPNNLYICANAKPTKDAEKAQAAHEKKEQASRNKLKEERKLEWQRKNENNGNNGGQQPSTATRA